MVVGLARTGDHDAFADLVRRRQSWIRNLMRRFCGNSELADDLAQKVFLQAWQKLSSLQHPDKFGSWLKRLAINVWLQHARKHDALNDADELEGIHSVKVQSAGMRLDLDQALSTLPGPVRFCIVLSYQEGMTHKEIAAHSKIPLGTVKSHIRRGTQKLQAQLAAYGTERTAKAPA